MCGIAGIIGRVGEANLSALAKMNRAMRHRGPDDEGTWSSPAGADGLGCMLTHRRLSILDLSPAGHQPMIDPVGGQAIVFNGEIYNYVDLRHELVAGGHEIKSTGDTAVMLRALAVWGTDAVRRLRGMFAFGMWDQKTRRLLLARDPLGIKPLYLCQNPEPDGDWSLMFASEVRAILASGLLKNPRLNPAAVSSVVWNGFVVGPQTAVVGIDSLPPGELIEFDERGRTSGSQQFWTFPHDRSQSASEADAAHAIEESVRLHLASDVPIGVFLSGGIDSSAVANLAQRQSQTPVHTFTLVFEEEKFNEGPHAAKIARAIGTHHREIMLTESRFIQTLQEAIGSLDQPTFDGLNSYFVSRAVREAGLVVALSGTGGDELFGGYTSFSRLPRLLRLFGGDGLHRKPARVLAAGAASAAVAVARRGRGSSVGSQTGWVKLPDILAQTPNLTAMYQLAYSLFLPKFQRELLGEACRATASDDGLNDPFRRRLSGELDGRSPLSAIGTLEHRLFLGERLLRDTDAASMAVSLETRLPLVDQNVSEAIEGVDEAARFEPLGRKAMLRRIGLRGLDPNLFERPKSGFVLPFDAWIRRGMGPAVSESLLDASRVSASGLESRAVAKLWNAFNDGHRGIYWSRLWAIFALVDWCHRYGVLL
jgi:asparagine synthase (glutamine-hydrolysing)